eukprot:TRINITY_DN8721_c0_g1_i1.p1 TRINITY_DN8721_c0_g1~~TRINITY_DN8721_c0_g1_i1.p1  ORF type:complete len:202 (-),score=40.49 TRINITY_DN8721_c0_g1_i1:107-673(-)
MALPPLNDEGRAVQAQALQACENVKNVVVIVDGEEVLVEVDPGTGPRTLAAGFEAKENHWQRSTHLETSDWRYTDAPRVHSGSRRNKPWKCMSSTEREVAIHIAAKKNKQRQALADTPGFRMMGNAPLGLLFQDASGRHEAASWLASRALPESLYPEHYLQNQQKDPGKPGGTAVDIRVPSATSLTHS